VKYFASQNVKVAFCYAKSFIIFIFYFSLCRKSGEGWGQEALVSALLLSSSQAPKIISVGKSLR
jgi:hypothetical protein